MFLADIAIVREPASEEAPALRWRAEVYEGDES